MPVMTRDDLDSATLRSLAKREVEQFRERCADYVLAVASDVGVEHEAVQYFFRHGVGQLLRVEQQAMVCSGQEVEQIRRIGDALFSILAGITGDERAEGIYQLVSQFVYRLGALGLTEQPVQDWRGQFGPQAGVAGPALAKRRLSYAA